MVYRKYLILLVFNLEVDSEALGKPLDGKMEPGSILVVRVIDSDPNFVLNIYIW